ncbi:MAG: class I SAM-dependent methyltransferase, partial [Planctomycetales bacterium]|nr:class I SAM-dependent methyltransferase [Planctomycetales bacterium]
MPVAQLLQRLTQTLLAGYIAVAWASPTLSHAAAPDAAASLIEQSQVRGGLVVHLGCGEGELTRSLRINPRYQVHGLDRNANHIDAARQMLLAEGVYGQVTASRLAGDELPLIDGLVNLLIVDEAQGIPGNEMLRVLAPQGVLMTRGPKGWTRHQKPRPRDIADWHHDLPDSSGHSVAHDA